MERDELEAQIRQLITACPHHTSIICTRCEERTYQVMDLIDRYAERRPAELWTADKVADYIGRKSSASARAWLSQNGIKFITTRLHPDSGRPQSLYPADEVRAVWFRKALT